MWTTSSLKEGFDVFKMGFELWKGGFDRTTRTSPKYGPVQWRGHVTERWLLITYVLRDQRQNNIMIVRRTRRTSISRAIVQYLNCLDNYSCLVFAFVFRDSSPVGSLPPAAWVVHIKPSALIFVLFWFNLVSESTADFASMQCSVLK